MENRYRISVFILFIISIFIVHSCKKEKVPTLTTSAINNITGTTASSGGTITNEGSGEVISRGVCWSTSISPSIADTKTTDGEGPGAFESNISSLNGVTTYYVRAYATNGVGTGYGMEMSFTTLGQTPSPTIASATSITATGATLNGSVNANYISTIVTFEYGTTTSYGSTITATQSPVSGSTNSYVSAGISGLEAATMYHCRIKAVNSLGTAYSNDATFTTFLELVPTVTALAPINITFTSATLNGMVNANFLSTSVTFEYGTTTSYGSTITATQSPVSGSTNSYVSAGISGLATATIYHCRTKAVNSLGTTYSNDLTFNTLGVVPAVTTLGATSITSTGAVLNGTVNANYLSTVVTFEYGTTTSYGSNVPATQSPVTGGANTNVSSSITGLIDVTFYHFRVKAENSLGTTYGSDLTFTASSSGNITDVDGNVYTTITIGTQVWMRENLKTTKYNDGTPIPNITVNTTWTALTTGAYCDFNNTPSNSDTYGRLYNWYAVDNNVATRVASNEGKNVCPTNWHMPTDAEWTTLTDLLGGVSVAGGKLKETGTIHWTSPNYHATNETGFTALPGGFHDSSGYYMGRNEVGYWWSSSEFSNDTKLAWGRYVSNYYEYVYRNNFGKRGGFSVRCLRD